MIYPQLSDLHRFYESPLGNRCQYFLGEYVQKFSQNSCSVGIIGYGLPYLRYLPNTVFSALPASQGIDYYQKDICLAYLDNLPLKNNSLDFLLIVHCFEFHESPLNFMSEVRRIIKNQGTVVIVAPYFLSYWLRKESNPFSLGKHYTPFKMYQFFNKFDLTVEDVRGVLHFPNLNALSSSNLLKNWEYFGQKFLPFFQNVVLYKVVKQVPSLIPPNRDSLKIFQQI